MMCKVKCATSNWLSDEYLNQNMQCELNQRTRNDNNYDNNNTSHSTKYLNI